MATDSEVTVVDESIPIPVSQSESINEPSTSAIKRPASPADGSTPRTTKKNKNGPDIDSLFLHSAIEKLETISSNASAALKKTEFDVFGESVAAQLNNMNFEDALELQLKIQKLMTEERIRIHKCTTEDNSLLSYLEL